MAIIQPSIARLINAAITARKAMDDHPEITVSLDIHEHWVTIWVRKKSVLALTHCVTWRDIELANLDVLHDEIVAMVERIVTLDMNDVQATNSRSD